jgi:hypothetical protein
LKVALASVVMAAMLKALSWFWVGMDALRLGLSIASGIVVFILAAFLFDVKELKEVVAWISRKR